MKDITLFFCDIYGTLSCSENPNYERINNVKKFVEKLVYLKNVNKSNMLIFSLITTENFEVANKYYYELLYTFIDKGINMGPFFTGNKIITLNNPNNKFNNSNSKIDNQLGYIKYILGSADYKIKKIYYADDSYFNAELLKCLIDKKYPNIECITFVPNQKNQDNMIETNKEINKYIKEKTKILKFDK